MCQFDLWGRGDWVAEVIHTGIRSTHMTDLKKEKESKTNKKSKHTQDTKACMAALIDNTLHTLLHGLAGKTPLGEDN